MNIQINCKSDVPNNVLTYLAYNMKGIIEDYEKNKDDCFHKENINGKRRWCKHLGGNIFINVKADCISDGKTMYIKVKEANNERNI